VLGIYEYEYDHLKLYWILLIAYIIDHDNISETNEFAFNFVSLKISDFDECFNF
jgi:hypothetical protein